MTAVKKAHGAWAAACARGDGPLVLELGECDCGEHAAHIVRDHSPLSDEFVVSTVWDLCCLPETTALAVWSETRTPGVFQLLVTELYSAVCMVGEAGPAPQVLEPLAGPLYAACLAALTPVPADDPLVLELAAIAGGA